MAKATVKELASPYAGCRVVLTTKHKKSNAIAPIFEKILDASVLEYAFNTDALGTFTGEVERKGTALSCVRRKCEWGLKKMQAYTALASEGSFGPHPLIPFFPSNREILYFIDKRRKFHLHVTDLYMETNYQMGEFCSFEHVLKFAEKALFPSHALIVRPYPRDTKSPIFKGIQSKDELQVAFEESIKTSLVQKAWVETDMRAHLNPSHQASGYYKIAHQ